MPSPNTSLTPSFLPPALPSPTVESDHRTHPGDWEHILSAPSLPTAPGRCGRKLAKQREALTEKLQVPGVYNVGDIFGFKRKDFLLFLGSQRMEHGNRGQIAVLPMSEATVRYGQRERP